MTIKESPANLFSQAADAVANLTKYGAHDIHRTIGDITQHLADCRRLNKHKELVTGIPFVLVWRYDNSALECISRNCSKGELNWLFENFINEKYLSERIRTWLAGDSTREDSFDEKPTKPITKGPNSSFKTDFFNNGASFVNFRFPRRLTIKKNHRQALALCITLILPLKWKGLEKFRESYCREFLKTLEKELNGLDLLRQHDKSVVDIDVGYSSLPESQSSFHFLQETLQTVLDHIKIQNSGDSRSGVNDFTATFLFRIAKTNKEESEQYRYVFTRSQANDLKKKHLSNVRARGGTVLDSFKNLPAIKALSEETQDTVKKWLNLQEEATLYEILTNGHWYGAKSFVNYVSSISRDQSMYINDWRIWYSPRQLFRTEEEEGKFYEWVADNRKEVRHDFRAEPLKRLLRSEVEQYYFGLESMFMIPIYGNSKEPPVTIVQISAPKLSPEGRIRHIQIIGFVYKEILGYMRADVLRERLEERERYDQFVDLAHLFTHAGTKLISTPMHNTLKRFDNALQYGRLKGGDRIDQWSIADGLFTTKTLETTLGILTRFDGMGAGQGGKYSASLDVNRRLIARGIDWNRVRLELKSFLETAFFRHFWNVCHDPDYKQFKSHFVQNQIDPFEMVRLNFQMPAPPPRCLGHTDLVIMHLSNLVENAVEAFDLLKSALNWQRNKDPLWDIRFNIEQKEAIINQSRKEAWVVLSVFNNSEPIEEEIRVLRRLDEIFRAISRKESDAFLRAYRIEMRNRAFTSKSGGSHGWALLEFASYLRRLELRKGNEVLQNGSISIFFNKGKSVGVEFEIRFPVKVNSDEREYFLEYSEEGT